jgi:serine protease Do
MHSQNPLRALCAALAVMGSVLFPTTARSGEAAFIGMHVQGMMPDASAALGLESPSGVLVRDVALGGPSAKAKVQRSDVIVRFADQDIDTFEKLLSVVGGLEAGESVKVTVMRAGAKVELILETENWPDGWRIDKGAFGSIPEVGVTVASLTATVRKMFGLRWGSNGVVVSLVNKEMSKDMDLLRGELIVQVNQSNVWQPRQFLAKFQEAKKNGIKHLLLLVEGDNGFRFSLLPVR